MTLFERCLACHVETNMGTAPRSPLSSGLFRKHRYLGMRRRSDTRFSDWMALGEPFVSAFSSWLRAALAYPWNLYGRGAYFSPYFSSTVSRPNACLRLSVNVRLYKRQISKQAQLWTALDQIIAETMPAKSERLQTWVWDKATNFLSEYDETTGSKEIQIRD